MKKDRYDVEGLAASISDKNCTEWMECMSHRQWKETKQQPGTAGQGNILGCCLVSSCFLCDIHPECETPLAKRGYMDMDGDKERKGGISTFSTYRERGERVQGCFLGPWGGKWSAGKR